MDTFIKKGAGQFIYDKGIHISLPKNQTPETQHKIYTLATQLKSWRKGPFYIDELYIDSEWQSFIKWDFLSPFLNLENANIADVGCNNGFYMFAIHTQSPKSITGFDPSALCYCQFHFINHFLDLPLRYELLGVQDLESKAFKEAFDVIFCLGVLYHRTDVFATLKSLASALRRNGILILDTLIFESDLEIALCPTQTYAKMRNVYLIPSIKAIEGWFERCGFCDVKLLGIIPTTTNEQRKTPWIDSLSLESFLDSSGKTIEGYPPPKRAYFKVRRK
ncbi:methyltransferase [Helicobacter fennelliae]|nr:methyltransferase [Helicobacter fennelliae]